MVVDPFSTLSLAGNIVQFLDFGGKLISKGKEIYKSASGSTIINVELEVIYKDLWIIANRLVAPSKSRSEPLTNAVDEQLRLLANSCQTLAKELLSALELLRLDSKDSHRRWKSVRQALKSVWKQSQIDELQDRLDSFRQQLAIRLLAIVGDQQSTVTREIQNLSSENTLMNLNQTKKLEDLTNLIEVVRQDVQGLSHVAINKADLGGLYLKLTDVALCGKRIAKEQYILSSLCYKYMTARRSKIVPAYTRTFDWIFEPQCEVGFVNWLQKQDSVYWISGKPGSGKSTLMKYLYEHKKTQEMLYKWAGGAELVTASFFFWSIGTHMQKSQEGLFRSLIFEILKQSPELIPDACPQLWDTDQEGWKEQEIWTLDELAATMHKITEQVDGSSKFCFFLDGLDEYEGHHPDIIRVIDTLSRSPFIKICASSRAWNVFKDAYGGNHKPKLYLEDLTRGDIDFYVRSKLEEHTHLVLLSLEGSGFDDLVNDIVSRAQGVFLWVYLVVLSLCEGLTNGDDIEFLQARVRRIPSDLRKFFRLIIESVEEVYKDKMAQTFQVVLQVSEPLTLVALSFLDEKEGYALNEPIKAMDSYEIFDRHHKMKRRINGRYKGLLEVTADPSATDFFNYRVDFFHRTVHDFIRLSEIQQLLQQYVSPGFDPHVSLCRIYLALVKKMTVTKYHLAKPGVFQDLLNEFMDHARQSELERGVSPIELIDEMESTAIDLANLHRCPRVQWNRKEIPRNESCKSFLELAIQCCLQIYVLHRLKEEPHFVHFRPVLSSVLGSLSVSQSSKHLSPQVPDMVEFLLRQGADPNRSVGSSTVFGNYLLRLTNRARDRTLQGFGDSEIVRIRARVLELLLQHHADPNVTQAISQNFPSSLQREVRGHVAIWGHLVLGLSISTTTSNMSAVGILLLKILLRHGADPNAPYYDCTIWEAFLRTVYQNGGSSPPPHQRVLTEVVKWLISHGADLDVSMDMPGMRYVSLAEVIRHAFPPSFQQEIFDVLNYRRKWHYSRRCCNFNAMRGLWKLRVAADPLWQVVQHIIDWPPAFTITANKKAHE